MVVAAMATIIAPQEFVVPVVAIQLIIIPVRHGNRNAASMTFIF